MFVRHDGRHIECALLKQISHVTSQRLRIDLSSDPCPSQYLISDVKVEWIRNNHCSFQYAFTAFFTKILCHAERKKSESLGLE